MINLQISWMSKACELLIAYRSISDRLTMIEYLIHMDAALGLQASGLLLCRQRPLLTAKYPSQLQLSSSMLQTCLRCIVPLDHYRGRRDVHQIARAER